MNKNNQSGFTLIELIVVIVILAILAVVAFPRFISYQRDAHLARADTAFASFESAVHLFHNKWLTQGEPPQTQTVDYGSGDIYPSVNGFPMTVDHVPYLSSSIPFNGHDCTELWTALMTVDLTISDMATDRPVIPSPTDIVAWYTTGEGGTTECIYHYTTGYSEDEKIPLMIYEPKTGAIRISEAHNNPNEQPEQS